MVRVDGWGIAGSESVVQGNRINGINEEELRNPIHTFRQRRFRWEVSIHSGQDIRVGLLGWSKVTYLELHQDFPIHHPPVP